MIIKKGSLVKINYELYDKENNLLDKTYDNPLDFVCGKNEIIEGLEEFLQGESAGFSAKVVINAEKAYGPYRDDLIIIIAVENFDDTVELKVGEHVETTGQKGEVVVFKIIKIDDNKVWLDSNHPFAGMDLYYKIEVVDVL